MNGGSGARVIVTGAGGFVGRMLVQLLLSKGHHVVATDVALEGYGASSGLEVVPGDFAMPDVRRGLLANGCDAIVHLASVPGGAAEADPAVGRRINLDATLDLFDLASNQARPPRVVFASTIAVFGDAMPQAGVDDETPISPMLLYGAQKAMGEIAVATGSNRGAINGVSLRLPGILARPQGPSGLRSAFMSDLFHALRAQERFTCPVSPGATIWAESVEQCARNLLHALTVDATLLPATRAITLPALRVSMGELAAEVARQCGVDPALVDYRPDPALEVAFGSQPLLATPAAERAGFVHDGSLERLVFRALERIAETAT